MDKKNILIISIVLVVVVVFSIIVYRKKKKDSLEKIIDAVDTDYKVLDDSITDELKHVKVDLTYNAENDYNIIKNADHILFIITDMSKVSNIERLIAGKK